MVETIFELFVSYARHFHGETIDALSIIQNPRLDFWYAVTWVQRHIRFAGSGKNGP